MFQAEETVNSKSLRQEYIQCILGTNSKEAKAALVVGMSKDCWRGKWRRKAGCELERGFQIIGFLLLTKMEIITRF